MWRVSSGFPHPLVLTPHASAAAPFVRRLEVRGESARPGELTLRYMLDADHDRIRVPARRAPRRADELWKHTCFEAFIAPGGSGSYYELNFSPSTEWQVYSFAGYREGMARADVGAAPQISVRHLAGQQLELGATIDVRAIEKLSAGSSPRASGRLALAAVIEDENGRLSYWALKHPVDKPDFHHPAGFVLEL